MAEGQWGEPLPSINDLLRSVRRPTLSLLPSPETPPDNVGDHEFPEFDGDAEPSTLGDDGVITFKAGDRVWKVSSADVIARFTVGSLWLTQPFDPQVNPAIEIYGLPEPIKRYMLFVGAKSLRPGRYEYLPNLNADIITLNDYIGDTLAPTALAGWPNPPGSFGGGNVVTTFICKPMPVSQFLQLTVHLDNRTNQTATLTLYGSYAQNPGTPPTGWNAIGNASVNANTDNVVSVDLDSTLYLYVIAVVTFNSAPTAGSFRVVPLARR